MRSPIPATWPRWRATTTSSPAWRSAWPSIAIWGVLKGRKDAESEDEADEVAADEEPQEA
ncbi:MAG: hypothetical protein R3D80_19335 [Paracoccaceae bacterium]